MSVAISTVDSLRRHLQWAIELEHVTIPPYLCALYSIYEGSNPHAVQAIRSVVVEEMLHLTLAANILNAVGGLPMLDSPSMLPSFPTCLPHSNGAFEVSLTKFSPEAVATFLKIERPEAHDGLPEDESYETIGQFYEAIEKGLTRVTGELGQAAVFSGDPARQVTDELYHGAGGQIIVVSDLDSALAALTEIVDQGEGLQDQEISDHDGGTSNGDREELAHYYRFNELAVGRRYQRGDTRASGPSGPELAVDWRAVHDMRPNPRRRDYPEGSEARVRMEEFNRSYSGILHLLHQAFNASPRMLAVALGAMYGLKEQAVALMALPSGDGRTTVGPSFEYVAPAQRHDARSPSRRVVVVADGPYLVYGDIPLVRKQKVVSDAGDSVSWKKTAVLATEENYALCRCGRSASKPFCDGTHARVGFDGTETADTRPTVERRRVLDDGHGIVVKRDGPLCMHAAFCVGRKRKIPAMLPDTGDSDVRAHVIAMIDRCPSGSYTYSLDAGAEDVEPDLPVTIAVTTEEDALGGALWLTGGIPVERSDGESFETRNRVTLCRCGRSTIKPLCDGTHREIAFRE